MAKAIITGDRKIDAMIRRLNDPKATNKILRKRMRDEAKTIRSAVLARSPRDRGGFRQAVKIFAGKRTRTGFRIYVAITRESLFAANPQLTGAAGQFYAAGEEWGDESREGKAPFRRGFDAERHGVRDRLLTNVKADVLQLAKR